MTECTAVVLCHPFGFSAYINTLSRGFTPACALITPSGFSPINTISMDEAPANYTEGNLALKGRQTTGMGEAPANDAITN